MFAYNNEYRHVLLGFNSEVGVIRLSNSYLQGTPRNMVNYFYDWISILRLLQMAHRCVCLPDLCALNYCFSARCCDR